MEKALLKILAVIFVVFTLPGNISALEDKILGVSELMRKVEEIYSSSKTFKSDFEQKYIDRNFSGLESSGEVYFKRPGMMRWIYKKPSKKIIASFENNMWIYDANDSQAILDKNFKKEKLPSSISFLWGDGKLLDIFNYRILSVVEVKGSTRYIVELLPKEEIPNVVKINFIVNGENFLIIETSLFDMFGNENRIIFSNTKLNDTIKDNFFKFEPPKGVTVIEPPKISK